MALVCFINLLTSLLTFYKVIFYIVGCYFYYFYFYILSLNYYSFYSFSKIFSFFSIFFFSYNKNYLS